MDRKDVETVWIGAFRYYLGRTTYAVDDFCQALVKKWPNMPDATKYLIQRELEWAFKNDDYRREENTSTKLGMKCDRASWELVRSLYK